MRPLVIWILFCCFFTLVTGCAPAESTPEVVPEPTITAPPKNAPVPTVPTECENPNIAAHLQAPAQVLVGQTFTVTVTLTNQGCGLVGLPQYTLQVTALDPGAALLPELPAPQNHSLGLNTNQSDRAEFSLQAAAIGKIQLAANASFEFHMGYPGPATWSSVAAAPIVIEILPAPKPQP